MAPRRRRKSIASTSEEIPKNDTAAETSVDGITDTQEEKDASRSELDNETASETVVEGITCMQEYKVTSRSELDEDAAMDERELEHSAVIVATNSVNWSIEYDNDATIDETEDDIIVANDENNGVRLNAAEVEVNEEIVAGGGVEEGEEDDEEVEDEEDDEGEEEVGLYVESNVDGDLAVNNDDGDEDMDDDIDDDEEGVDEEKGDEDEDEEDEEENDDNYEVGDDNKLENENKEKHEEDVKVANDAGSQENTLTEEVTKGNGKKGVNVPGERLKKKVRPAGNMNDEKKIPGGVSGQENLKAEHDGRQGDSCVMIEEADGGKSKEKIGVGGEGGNSKQKGKKLRKESRMKTVNGGSKIVSSEREDKPKQLPKKKSSKKVKSMGMIFICSTKTRNDCFQYKVLGLPASKKETVEKIYKGMRLFLYDTDRRLLHGIYKAAGPGGYNIQPKAFNSQFPAQVRFTILEDCLPIAEEKFKRVIKDNYFTKKKFDTLLTSQQVKDLCKLFAATKHSKHGAAPIHSKYGASEKPGRDLKRKAHVPKRRDRSRDRDEGLRSAVNDKHRYREYSPYRERALPPLHQAPRLPPLRTAAPPLPYAYERALDVDVYRQDPLVERRDRRDGLIERRDPYIEDALVELHDPYRQDAALVERRDPYRQDALVDRLGSYRRPVLERDAYRPVSLLEHRDVYRPRAQLLDHGSSYAARDAVVQRHDLSSLDDEYRRLDPLISYRRVGSSGDDSTMLDRYRSYRDRAVYRDPVSTTRLVPEEDGYTVGRRSAAALLSEYRSVRPRYQY